MSNIAALVDIYKIENINPVTKANLLIELGRAINDEYSMNLTGDLVAELIATLPVNREQLKRPGWLPQEIS